MYIRSTHKLRESEKHELLIIHLWIKEGVHSVIWSFKPRTSAFNMRQRAQTKHCSIITDILYCKLNNFDIDLVITWSYYRFAFYILKSYISIISRW